ncbi:MAG: hypothetical protein ABEJ95_05660 [Candidatus Nanohalobium sp.]
MKIYLAGMEERRKIKLAREHGIKYWMVSLASLNDHAGNKLDEIIRLKPDDVKLALDNGFFSIQNTIKEQVEQGNDYTLNWGDFVGDYIDLLKKNDRHEKLSFYPVIDPPFIEGQNQSIKALEHMEMAGLEPTPVWHLGWGTEYLEKLVDEYDYICIGAVASEGSSKKQRNALIPVLEYCKENGVKTHLFGVTSPSFLSKVRNLVYSADSTSWSYGPRAGEVFFTGEQYEGYFKSEKLENLRDKSEFFDISNYQHDEYNIKRWKPIEENYEQYGDF